MRELLKSIIVQPFTNLLEWLSLTPWWFFTFLTIVSGWIVFFPSTHLRNLGLATIRQDYLPVIGVIFVVSTGLWLTLTARYLWDKGKEKYHQRKLRNHQKEKLRNLTPKEKKILRPYISKNTWSQYLPMESGTVNELKAHNVITIGSKVSSGYKWAYVIQPWAKEYLEEHPVLVDLERA